MNILQTQAMSYSYEKGIPVLEKLSLTFEDGKMYAVLGPSGAGKSTLLSLLGGLDVPKEGRILYEGEDIRKKGLSFHRKKHISFIFQNYNLIDYMTAAENVMVSAPKCPRDILLNVGLTEDEIERNVLRLSGGQQQRVAVARALATDAGVILADEPTGNLDESTGSVITELLRKSATVYGKCVIVVTHSERVADQADTVFELKRSRSNYYDMCERKKD